MNNRGRIALRDSVAPFLFGCGRYRVVPCRDRTHSFAYILVPQCMALVLLQSVVVITTEITFTLSVKINTFFAAQNMIHACKDILL